MIHSSVPKPLEDPSEPWKDLQNTLLKSRGQGPFIAPGFPPPPPGAHAGTQCYKTIYCKYNSVLVKARSPTLVPRRLVYVISGKPITVGI